MESRELISKTNPESVVRFRSSLLCAVHANRLGAATFFKEERDPFYKRGQAKGIEKERAKAEAEKRKIALEFKNLGVSITDIAKGTCRKAWDEIE